MNFKIPEKIPVNTSVFLQLLDPALPIWIQEAFLKAIPEFYNYFEERTRNSLSFTPLFIINFQAGSVQQRMDGGAANKQLAINIVGDGWSQNSDTELLNVLSLLAHEMAHLWDAQHLDVWNELVTTSDSLAYSERDFIQALYKESANNNEVALIEDALQKESGEKFEALVGKYIGRHNHKNPIRSDAEAAIE